MTVALYCRVSTEEQATQGFSIHHQRERLIAYCASQGWHDYQLYVDDGFTGTNLERPALKRVIQAAKDNVIDTVVVYKLDRLGRKQKDVLHLLEDVFDKHGVTFKSATEPFDTSSSLGKAMLGILAVFAQLERDTIVERTTSGRRQRIRSGLWHGGRVPFGYEWDKENQQLCIVAQEAQLVRQVYRLYLQGRSLSELAMWLGDRTTSRAVSHVTIKDMLERPIYAGHLSTGTGDLVKGNHEPIIDDALWAEVLAERERRREGLSPAGNYLLSGLCVCGICGGAIIHVPHRRRGRTYSYYCCKNQHIRRRAQPEPKPCRLGYKRQEELERLVEASVRRLHLDAELVHSYHIEESSRFIDARQSMADLKDSLKQLKLRMDRWYSGFEEGVVSSSQLQERIARLETDKEKLELRLTELEETFAAVDESCLFHTTQVIDEAWDNLSLEERQAVLRSAVKRIIVYPGEKLTMEWNT